MAAPMKKYRFGFLLVYFLCAFSWVVGQELNAQHQNLNGIFKEFVVKYNRSYAHDGTEYEKRFINFKHNVERAEILNKDHAGKTAVYGINKFSDLSPEEFNDMYLSGYSPKTSMHFETSSGLKMSSHKINTTGLPQKIDWRTKGAVTKIKNQQTCGACWAFTVSEVMESMLAIQHGYELQTLSAQELIDCDSLEAGCRGGDICSSTRWAARYGIVEDKHYPLKDKTETCRPIPDTIPRVRVHSYACNRYVDKEEEILSLLTRGPVAVAVDAKTWHGYVQGVIQFHCATFINHAVVLVGYDLTGDVPYYIARNSWGTDFGDDGYLYIKVGDNLCGLALEVVFLTVDLPQ